MSERARVFVEEWIADAVHATGYEPENSDTRARLLAVCCIGQARTSGLSPNEIDSEFGSLTLHMCRAIESATDDEIDRLAGKDDLRCPKVSRARSVPLT
jgi:hypothetical protein